MKQNVRIAFTMMLILLLTVGCSQSAQSPSEAAALELDNIKKEGSNYYFNTEIETGFSNEFMDLLFTKMPEFEYEITGEAIEENTAHVYLTITTYNFGDAISDANIAFAQEALSQLERDDVTEEELKQLLMDKLTAAIETLTFTYTVETEMYLVKEEDTWVLGDNEANFEMIDAIYGGLLTYAERVNGSL